MKTKFCLKCQEHKNIIEFHKNKTRKDGYANRCKSCRRKDFIEYEEKLKIKDKELYLKKKEEEMKRKKEYRKTHNYRISQRISNKKYRENNPEKRTAQNKLGSAVRYGKIKKPDLCSICNKTNCIIHGHHENYSKPLDVIWCCKECHTKIHKMKNRGIDIVDILTLSIKSTLNCMLFKK